MNPMREKYLSYMSESKFLNSSVLLKNESSQIAFFKDNIVSFVESSILTVKNILQEQRILEK